MLKNAVTIGSLILLLVGNIFAADDIKRPDGTIDVTKLNALLKQRGAKWVAAENEFSRMTTAQRRAWIGTERPDGQVPEKQVTKAVSIPYRFNWRNNNGNWMTPIRNQDSCGACWAFAVVGMVEALVNIAEKNPDRDYDLSEQTLVTCSNAGNCHGGRIDKALEFVRDTGIAYEFDDPYNIHDSICTRSPFWQDDAEKITKYSFISKANIKNVLLENPLVTDMIVYEDFYDYSKGIYSFHTGDSIGLHAVVIVGWDDGDSCWIARNSWGINWGDSGYFRIAYNNNVGFPDTQGIYDADYTSPLAITLTSPNGGGSLEKGLTYTIKWTCSRGDSFKVDLYKGGNFNSTIIRNTSKVSSYKWTVPTTLATGSDYKIRVTNLFRPYFYDESDNNFTIATANITVTSPNGSESWAKGLANAIKWTSAVITGNVKIELYKNGALNSTISSNASNTGNLNWTISTALTTASDYKIRITSISRPSIWDESNANFTIMQQGFNITSPNGGERWLKGYTYKINWLSAGISGNVKIELYKGTTLNSTISSNASNTGSYNWTVPTTLAVGTDYKIKVTSLSNTSLYDFSNANFNIVAAIITVTVPSTKVSWQKGTTQTIKWTSAGVSGNVRIQLYKSGVLNKGIGETANTGSYSWTISTTQAAGADYKVRITSVSNTAIWDESDYYFNIVTAIPMNALDNKKITEYKLYPAAPNPATNHTVIKYQVPEKTNINLRIYDKSGRVVKTLVSGEKDCGYYEQDWNGRDDAGKLVSNGVYIYKFESAKYKAAKQLIW